MSAPHPTRRDVLRQGAALAGVAALGPLAGALPRAAAAPQAASRVKRVVVARFGGGVRLSETFAHPDPLKIIPRLTTLAKQGVLYTNVRNQGRLDHITATAQLLTGNSYPSDAPLKASRLPHPTIFEYYRKKTLAGPESCLLLDPHWHPTHLDYSSHPDYGNGAVELLTRRNAVWHLQFVQGPLKQTDPIWKEAEALKQALLAEDYEHLANQVAGTGLDEPVIKEYPKVEQYRKSLFVTEKIPRKIGKTPVQSGDMLTLFCAQRAFQDDKHVSPTILVANFHGPDVAHGGHYTQYEEAVRQLDAVIGEFYAVCQSDNKLARNTAFVVTQDVGRDLSATGGGFASHRSGDLGCRRLFTLVCLPGMRGGSVVERVVPQTALCPTIGAWLGVPTPHVPKDVHPLAEVV